MPGSHVAPGAARSCFLTILLSCHLTPRYLQALTGHENIIRLQNVVRAETLVPQGAKAPKQKPEEEPTYRLRKKMGLV